MSGLFSRIKEVERLERISAVLVKHGLGYVLSLLKLRKGVAKKTAPAPEALVKVCEELGGTFTKLGQFLSLRPDLLPHEYSEAFEELQERVPPFSSEKAKHIVADQLRHPLLDIFSHFETKPVAAASIGQVHRAKLKTGEDVAVKVMRPTIKEAIMTDLLLLYRLAALLEHHLKPAVFDALLIIEEFRKYTEEELDYRGEARALNTAAANFKGIKRVKVPKPFEQWSTKNVLTMEFIPGKSLRASMKKLPRHQRRHLAKEVTHIVLKQVFIDGYFHADPHPGNIILVPDGKVGLIDFGITGTISQAMREDLTILFLSLINKDADGVIKAMAKLHFFDRHGVTDNLKEDIISTLRPYYGVSVDQVDVASLFLKALHVAREHKVRVPTNLVLLGKAVMTLKGVAEELDPEFDILSVAKPFISELLQRKTDAHTLIHKAAEQAIDLRSFITRLPLMTEEYFATTARVEQDLQRIGYQISLFSDRVTRMLRQALFLIILAILAALAFASWEESPLVLGVSVVSVAAGVVGVLVCFAFLSTFFRTMRGDAV
ncbi:AarF/ABC1/UbiB kinase family protein [Candidatus Woesearchaeota archaeon]|nr:AarF/ABC1/UbiB kinase family protein [Candidatus Woesearchaeota archaeon]